MSKPKHRPSRRKRRGPRSKATPFARPIRDAIAAAAVVASRRLPVFGPAAAQISLPERAPSPVPQEMQAGVIPAAEIAVDSQSAAAQPPPFDDQPPHDQPGVAAIPVLAAPEHIGRHARMTVLAQLRSYYHPLMVPVMLAALVIGLSNRLPSRVQPGSHIAPSPAVSSSAPPAETLQSHTPAPVPDIAAVPNSNVLTPLAALPPVETIAALSMPAKRSGLARADSDGSDMSIVARDTDFVPRTRACASAGLVPFGPVATPDAGAFGRGIGGGGRGAGV